jgi:hypothetical protein
MYGVPTDLDLSTFTGARLLQVSVSRFQAQFIFGADRTISVEGKWQIFDDTGNSIVDVPRDSISNDAQFQMLVGERVVAGSVNAPDWFELHFQNGFVLRVFDDSQEFESFSIQPGNIFV